MTWRELLRKAAEMPLDDETYASERRVWATKWDGRLLINPGGGFVCALKRAAGPDIGHDNYCEAQGRLDEYCDPLVPLEPQAGMPWGRGRIHSAIAMWAADKTVEQRRALLLELADG